MGRTRDVSKILTSNTSILTLASASTTYQTKATAGLTLINTTSFSSASAVSLPENTFSATYDNYRIIYTMTTSGGQDLGGRMRLAGSDNSTASSYVRQRLYVFTSTVQAQAATANSWATFGTTSGSNISHAIIELFNPFLASQTGFTLTTGGGADHMNSKGYHNQSVSYDSFTLICTANMTGTYSVYGYNK